MWYGFILVFVTKLVCQLFTISELEMKASEAIRLTLITDV